MMWGEGMRIAAKLVLSAEERADLEGLVRSGLTCVRLSQRSQRVLLAAESMRDASE
jgi:hypothetical protein